MEYNALSHPEIIPPMQMIIVLIPSITDLKNLIEEYQIADELMENTFHDSIEPVIDEVLENFDISRGVSEKGYEIMDKCICDFWEEARYIGRERTGIIELYLLAFKLATQQLKERF